MNNKSRTIYRLSIVLALVIAVLLPIATAIEESNSSHSKVNKTQGMLWTKVLKEKRAGKLNVTAQSIEPLSLPVTKTRVLLNLKLNLLNDTQRESAIADIEGYGASNVSVYKYVNVTAAEFPIDKLDELASLEYVEGILDAEEQIFEPKLDNSIPSIKANYTYSLGMNGSGVRVAVIDTGIDHDTNLIKIARDNAGQLLQYNALNGTTTNNDIEDHDGHGTHVAGIIAAQRHQYGGRWLQGVAPGAEIVPVKVFDKNDSRSGTTEPIVRGIDWAIEQDVDIIHMSLGTILPENYPNYWVDTWGETDYTEQMAAIRNAVDRGITVVISSGNEADNHASGQQNQGQSKEIRILPTGGNVTVYFYTQTNEGDFNIRVKNATGTEVLQSNYLNDNYLIKFDINTFQQLNQQWTLNITRNQGSGGDGRYDIIVSGKEEGDSVNVVPADRDSFHTVTIPGNVEKAITVGAVDNNGGLAEFSSRGPLRDGGIKPDIVAPGVGITSLAPIPEYPDGHLSMSGTSMAAPHVSGAAAVLIQFYREQYGRDLNPAEIKALLMGSAVDASGNLSTTIDNEYGAGILNVYSGYISTVSHDVVGLFQPDQDDYSVRIPQNNPDWLKAKGVLYWDDTDDDIDLSLFNPGNTQVASNDLSTPIITRIVSSNPSGGIWRFNIFGKSYGGLLDGDEEWFLGASYPPSTYIEKTGIIRNNGTRYYIDIPNNAEYLRALVYWDNASNNIDIKLYDPNKNLTDYSNLTGVSIEQAGVRLPISGRWLLDVYGPSVDVSQSYSVLSNYDPIKILSRSGGPDHFGYKFIDSNAPAGPAYEWIDITSSGTMILPGSDDYYVDGIPVGFFFNFYGTDYSQVSVTNNGITLASGGTSQWYNQPIGGSSPHNFIAPFWDDLVTWGSAGAVYYQTIGTAPNRKFIVEWYDNQGYSSTPSGITFEAILYEGTNDIKFQYKDTDFGSGYYNKGASATVGIEGNDGRGLQYSFNEPVIDPGLAILFKFPAFSGTNMYLTKNAPASMDHGNTMTYTLYFNNFGSVFASNVVLQDTLPSNVEFISASDGGTYDSATRKVTWNMGLVAAFPTGRGSRTVTVRIPNSVPVGTVIQNTASISTSTLETRYDDNSAVASTAVTGSNLPPDVSVGPTNGNTGGTPSVYWGTPVTFTYYSSCATNAGINIHINDGGSDITGSMLETSPDTWIYTTTFYPRHGAATVTYTLSGCAALSVAFNIYIDPAGYIYDINTGARISGATVWLQRPDGSGG